MSPYQIASFIMIFGVYLVHSNPVKYTPDNDNQALSGNDRYTVENIERVPENTNQQQVRKLKTRSLDTFYFDDTPRVVRVRRSSNYRQRYDDSDNYYDNDDWAGYDRKGSDVGYLDKDDDAPTVVW
ncbi:uncharacterized protein LOC115884859 [Sitophilus oryzae]|uniref:Uncharacterized protein LOC115884859 n=1 Tax=Sitophilus oryzae TaxID=7048 RepID=A0A6J2Y8F9_SITOR|nr:uncharacterized protein LOC115884859 [Sitophilus oryzae]